MQGYAAIESALTQAKASRYRSHENAFEFVGDVRRRLGHSISFGRIASPFGGPHLARRRFGRQLWDLGRGRTQHIQFELWFAAVGLLQLYPSRLRARRSGLRPLGPHSRQARRLRLLESPGAA